MKYSIKDNKNSSKKIKIQFLDEDLMKAKNITFEYFRKNLKKDGFRKGYLPDDIILKEVGDNNFKNELKTNALELFYSEIIKEEKLIPISSPSIKEISEDPLVFELIVDIYPEIKNKGFI
jgi:trigger factor